MASSVASAGRAAHSPVTSPRRYATRRSASRRAASPRAIVRKAPVPSAPVARLGALPRSDSSRANWTSSFATGATGA